MGLHVLLCAVNITVCVHNKDVVLEYRDISEAQECAEGTPDRCTRGRLEERGHGSLKKVHQGVQKTQGEQERAVIPSLWG